MEGKSKVSSSSSSRVSVAAPFVVKTYEMVSEPMTDTLIGWGRADNTFLVLDPLNFSQLLLPYYFKHSNFSSFLRQLNLYGFKKVDPDKWEFAHESFLRGQIHLLPLIIRHRNKKFDIGAKENFSEETEEEEMLLQEVRRLREEQKSFQGEINSMSKRLLITESGPHRVVSFLVKVAEDPELLPRLILSKKEQWKKQKLSTSLPPLPKSLEFGERSDLDSCSGDYGDGNNVIYSNLGFGGMPVDHIGSPRGQVILLPEFGVPEATTVAYPFSLLGHVFF